MNTYDRRIKNIAGSAVALAAVLMPFCSAHAFIDERTPPQPVELPAVQPVQQHPETTAAAERTGMVWGDVGDQVWRSPYPGPFGQMPLSDALIAHVVPILGRAIELSGQAALLDRRVTISKDVAYSRLESLQQIARTQNIDIVVRGSVVTLGDIGMSGATAAAVEQATPQITFPITKTWVIPSGVMLSGAMLDWAKEWDWHLVWQADVDYRISAPIVLTGDFLQTVGQILDAYRTSNRPLWGDWNSQQKILIIREPGSRDR